MNKKLLWLLTVFLLACVNVAEAQQTEKIPRIGVLVVGTADSSSRVNEPFIQRMRELGYVDGKNIVFEHRSAGGKLDRLPEMAAELVRSDVAVIVTSSTPATLAAKKATSTIPIVVRKAGDLVGSGLVASLAKPGGNVTVLTAISPDLSGEHAGQTPF